ncbi:MAG: RNA polymerase sigma factor [Planctomycetota bacterium]|jgi:RNA polymerase sigma factor (sigma-70 family)
MPAASVSQECDTPSNVDRAAEVFEENGDFIRAIIRFYIKHEAEAEDLFQDLFLFLIARPIPSDVRNLRGFLFKVINDTVKDVFRGMERRQSRIHKYAQHNGHVTDNRPENVLMEAEEAKRMFELIERRLPPKEALAVTLRYRDNCDTDEVAKRMGVERRSVSRYVSVGLRRIRHVLCER